MFGASVSIDRVWLHRLGSGVVALVLVATPAATWADESPVATCSAQAREGLARVGAWATAQCDTQTLSFTGLSGEFRKFEVLCRDVRPGGGPGSQVGIHDIDQLSEGALVGERIPAVVVVQRQAIAAPAERSQTEAWIGTGRIDAAQHQVTAPGLNRHAACRLTVLQQALDGGYDRWQPGRIWAALGWGHARQCATDQ